MTPLTKFQQDQQAIATLRAENTRLREALEASRIKHKVVEEDCFYSCPLSGECCNAEGVNRNKCNCGASEHNARIDETLGVKHE